MNDIVKRLSPNGREKGMSYWSALIWIGNTLLPRWFVFGLAFAVLLILISTAVWLMR